MKNLKLFFTMSSAFIVAVGLTSFALVMFNIDFSTHEKLRVSTNDKVYKRRKTEHELASQLHQSIELLKTDKNIDRFLSVVQKLVNEGANPFYDVDVKLGQKRQKINFFNRLYNHFSYIDDQGVPLRMKLTEIFKLKFDMDLETYLKSQRGMKDGRDLFFMDINSIRSKSTLISYVLNAYDSGVISVNDIADVESFYSEFQSISQLKRILNEQFLSGVLKFSKKTVAYFVGPSKDESTKI